MVTKYTLFLTCAAGVLALGAGFAHAAGASGAGATDNSGGTTLGELVVTAEKREQNLQTVPIAISAYTAAKRQLIGIDSIQDMTNFTPGLEYNSSTDRISLRGVGRQTNVLSADAAVANYSDGIYETFAVGAGESTLFLDRVEVLRGPQGTLYGRNSIAGALNEISRHPTMSPYAEVRATIANYDHFNLEGAVSGPITDNIQLRLAGNWEKQTQGWITNVVPGEPSEGNVINQWFLEGQIQWKMTDHLDFWAKVGFNQWLNGAGGPGSQSEGWTPFPFEQNEYGNTSTELNPGYGCTGIPTNVVNPSPYGCYNPAQKSPWLKAAAIPYHVFLPDSYTIAAHLTYHLPNFDIKYITGGVNYHYILTGPSGSELDQGYIAPITSYTLPGGLVINPQEAFNYQELNASWSHEVDFISTNPGPFQWQAGAYYFRQHYDQPVYTTNPSQSQWYDPDGAAGFFCANTGGVCAVSPDYRRYDNRPSVTNITEAVFAQIDWKASNTLKFTVGARYSYDRKYGTESVRFECFGVPSCYAEPEFNGFIPGGLPAVDLSQYAPVTSSGTVPGVGLASGVTCPTYYNAQTGFATRCYDASWDAVTGTAGVEWTPDEDTLMYAKYSRGYKAGGFNIGIYTVLNQDPESLPEYVDSWEIGFKKTWMHNLTTDIAMFYYKYYNLQIPITVTNTSGALGAVSYTGFYNVPDSLSRGIELETTWTPIRNLNILFDYSYLDAYIESGYAVDFADPDAVYPGAKPLPNTPGAPWTPDVFTGGMTKSQNLAGNRLPNAPRNKIALNGNYTWHFTAGSLNLSMSYLWRDAQYGTLFTRDYNRAPAWDQVDGRLTWNSAEGHYKIIMFAKNIFNTIGYDAGAYGSRVVGMNDNNPFLGQAASVVNQGIGSTYSVTPPRTYGMEVDYKF